MDVQLRRPPRMPHNAARIPFPRPERGLVLQYLDLKRLFYDVSIVSHSLLMYASSRFILTCSIAEVPAGFGWHAEIESDFERIFV